MAPVRRDRTLAVTFTCPAELNSLTEQALAELEQVLDTVEQDPTIRVLTLTGTGKAFCVGLDAELLERAFAAREVWEALLRRVGRLALRI